MIGIQIFVSLKGRQKVFGEGCQKVFGDSHHVSFYTSYIYQWKMEGQNHTTPISISFRLIPVLSAAVWLFCCHLFCWVGEKRCRKTFTNKVNSFFKCKTSLRKIFFNHYQSIMIDISDNHTETAYSNDQAKKDFGYHLLTGVRGQTSIKMKCARFIGWKRSKTFLRLSDLARWNVMTTYVRFWRSKHSKNFFFDVNSKWVTGSRGLQLIKNDRF